MVYQTVIIVALSILNYVGDVGCLAGSSVIPNDDFLIIAIAMDEVVFNVVEDFIYKPSKDKLIQILNGQPQSFCWPIHATIHGARIFSCLTLLLR